MLLENRVAIVTGAGRGIGRGIARHLAKNGATVAIAEFRRNLLDEATAELTELGAPNLGIECDVGSRDSIFAMVDAVLAFEGARSSFRCISVILLFQIGAEARQGGEIVTQSGEVESSGSVCRFTPRRSLRSCIAGS